MYAEVKLNMLLFRVISFVLHHFPLLLLCYYAKLQKPVRFPSLSPLQLFPFFQKHTANLKHTTHSIIPNPKTLQSTFLHPSPSLLPLFNNQFLLYSPDDVTSSSIK